MNSAEISCLIAVHTTYLKSRIFRYATVSFALKVSGCTKIPCVRKVRGPPAYENLVCMKYSRFTLLLDIHSSLCPCWPSQPFTGRTYLKLSHADDRFVLRAILHKNLRPNFIIRICQTWSCWKAEFMRFSKICTLSYQLWMVSSYDAYCDIMCGGGGGLVYHNWPVTGDQLAAAFAPCTFIEGRQIAKKCDFFTTCHNLA